MTTIAEYYIDKYGRPEREAEFISPGDVKIEIYKWNEEQTGEGVTMYATLGASDILGDEKQGCEFFIGMAPAADGVVQALAEVALHGNGSRDRPCSGDSISLAYPLWKGTEAHSFMFTDGEEIVPPIQSDGRQIDFIQLVPLFDSELDFKKTKGEVALWERFKEQSVPYWDSTREASF